MSTHEERPPIRNRPMDAKDSPKRIWVKFAETSLASNPLHIRMWQQEPFVGAAEYVQIEECAIDRFDSAAIMWSLDGAPLKPSPDGMWVRFADVQRLIDASLKSRGA